MSHLNIAPWANISAVNPNDGISYAYIFRVRQHPTCNPHTSWAGCTFLVSINFKSLLI